jgi:hypothetical protein
MLCTMPLVLRRLIELIAQGNRLSLAFALLLTLAFFVEGLCNNYQKFMANRYVSHRCLRIVAPARMRWKLTLCFSESANHAQAELLYKRPPVCVWLNKICEKESSSFTHT